MRPPRTLKNICLYSLCNKCAALPIQCDYFIKNFSSLYLKLGKTCQRSDCNRKGIPDLWALVKNCEFFQISSAMMHAIVVGSSGAIAMNCICSLNAFETEVRKL